jgi:hypothetical protein
MRDGILLLIAVAPSFVSKIINEYIHAYSIGLIDRIVPLEVKKMRSIIAEHIAVERQLVDSFTRLHSDQKDLVVNFFKVLG